MTYYFTPETQLRTDNKQAIFTIEEDGSIVFTEKFDIVVVILDADYQNKTSTPIATLSLSSKLQKNHAVEHTYSVNKVQAHDGATKNFIEEPRGKFAKFFSWHKDSLTLIFNHVEKAEMRKRDALTTPRRKL